MMLMGLDILNTNSRPVSNNIYQLLFFLYNGSRPAIRTNSCYYISPEQQKRNAFPLLPPPRIFRLLSHFLTLYGQTVSFLTYLLKSFADYIKQHEESICKSVVNLLVTCSDSVSIRKVGFLLQLLFFIFYAPGN